MGARPSAVLRIDPIRVLLVRPQVTIHAAVGQEGRQVTLPVVPPRPKGGLALAEDTGSLVPLLDGAPTVAAVTASVGLPRRVGPVGVPCPGQERPLARRLTSRPTIPGVIVRLRLTGLATLEVALVIAKAPAGRAMGLGPRRCPALGPMASIGLRAAAPVALAGPAVAVGGLHEGR